MVHNTRQRQWKNNIEDEPQENIAIVEQEEFVIDENIVNGIVEMYINDLDKRDFKRTYIVISSAIISVCVIFYTFFYICSFLNPEYAEILHYIVEALFVCLFPLTLSYSISVYMNSDNGHSIYHHNPKILGVTGLVSISLYTFYYLFS